jgi:hypothetical protein
MQRYFTLREAESVLPEVEQAIRSALELKRFYVEAEQVLQDEASRIQMSGGAMVNSARLSAEKSRRDTCASQLKNAIEQIHSHGCEVKDLDIGLIDFRTFYRGDEVCLCWRLGEEGISWWHGLEEGFRGRRPVDADFMANHGAPRS